MQVATWLKNNRFAAYVSTFSNFSGGQLLFTTVYLFTTVCFTNKTLFTGADLLRLSRDDLIQICGLADGIRLNNALQSK